MIKAVAVAALVLMPQVVATVVFVREYRALQRERRVHNYRDVVR